MKKELDEIIKNYADGLNKIKEKIKENSDVNFHKDINEFQLSIYEKMIRVKKHFDKY